MWDRITSTSGGVIGSECIAAMVGVVTSIIQSAISARLSRLTLEPEGARTIRTLLGSLCVNTVQHCLCCHQSTAGTCGGGVGKAFGHPTRPHSGALAVRLVSA